MLSEKWQPFCSELIVLTRKPLNETAKFGRLKWHFEINYSDKQDRRWNAEQPSATLDP